MKQPDFNNLLRTLERKPTDKPVLFEMFMNGPLYEQLNGEQFPRGTGELDELIFIARAFANGGYDYVSTHASSFGFGAPEREGKHTISLNDSAGMTSWREVQDYPWLDPDDFDYSKLEKAVPYLPDGMKLQVMGPGGVLENVIALVGYDNLCYLLFDDPGLVERIFSEVGQRLVRYYENAVRYGAVGSIISNDDWGFNTQPFLSPDDMRRYVYPWHKKIVETAHRAGRPVILHSCGNLNALMDDIINELQYDGKHSYEDNIIPVEEAYEKWGSRIAILGGIDLDFIVRSNPQAIQKRGQLMLERSRERGGYALGSGNSIPEYVPDSHYYAMIDLVRNG